MKCNYIQNLIIEITDVTDPKQNYIVDKHLAQCDECAKFSKNVTQTRRFIRNIEPFEPPFYLIDLTMKRCNNVLAGQKENLPVENHRRQCQNHCNERTAFSPSNYPSTSKTDH